MRPWPRTLRSHLIASPAVRFRGAPNRRFHATRFAASDHERVDVRCGSSGHVTVDLFNVSKHPPDARLMVHLPAFPSSITSQPALPAAFQNWPVARINYRWDRPYSGQATLDDDRPPSQWPAPVHDTAFAYSWIVNNLAPAGLGRRDIYVYGSFLGASLAASLALTESHPHAPFAVRGLVAYNGVYNWTMFLPEHPIHKADSKSRNILREPPPLAKGEWLERLNGSIAHLFPTPSDLFDPFASPSIFFHNPGLHIPQEFGVASSPLSDLVSQMTGQSSDDDPAEEVKPPRKSHLVFPPRASTLKIPETLLVYDKHVAPVTVRKRRVSRRLGHTLTTQAFELADLMRRSVDKVELKERRKWDDEMEGWQDESLRRVQLLEVDDAGGHDLGADSEDLVRMWLDERG